MKDWQHGLDLEYLKLHEAEYDGYNAKIRSPFSQFKKHHIAEALWKKEFRIIRHQFFYNVTCTFTLKEMKSASNIFMHGDTLIGRKEKGDLVIEHIAGESELLIKELQTKYFHENVWMIVPAGSYRLREIAQNSGFKFIGIKINTFSDMFAIFFRDALDEKRKHPHISPAEKVGMKKLFNFEADIMKRIVLDRIESGTVKLPWIDHYSNYNKDNAWSAVSLRGYSPDPQFIEKPEEMSDKWKEEHKGQDFKIQDTDLMIMFPYINAICKHLETEIYRVRFMKLAPGGGELERHTDQVDPDTGTDIGKQIRLHFPVKTNPDVTFTTWNEWDQELNYHFGLGECWYLDTRKPHKAVNNGREERIHLVIDVRVNEQLQRLIGDDE